MSNNKQTTEPMVVLKTSSTHTAQGIYVQHLKKNKTMSKNQQETQPENPNNQFSNTEPLTHAQRVAIANTMNNNKQSMKLYTEEQLKEAFNCGRLYLGREGDTNFYYLIDRLTPIELPSDEEVEQYLKSFPYTKHLDDGQYNDGKIVGAELAIQWFRDKIQGGNNEQQ